MVFPVRFVAEGQTVQSTSRDLDEGSVFVRCVEPPERGERVVLRLYLPGIAAGDSLEAAVTETSSEGFRASFTDLSEEARQQILAASPLGRLRSRQTSSRSSGCPPESGASRRATSIGFASRCSPPATAPSANRST